MQLYYPFADLEQARREAAADVHRGDTRHHAAQVIVGAILVVAAILGAVYLR